MEEALVMLLLTDTRGCFGPSTRSPAASTLLGKRARLRIFALAMKLNDLLVEGYEFVRALRSCHQGGDRRSQDARKYRHQPSPQHVYSNNALNVFQQCAPRS